MTCHDAREWLSALLDDALEPDRRAEVEAHLAGCADCRFERDRLGATVSALRGLDRPRAPVGFVDRVVSRLRPVPWYRRLAAWLFLPLSIKLPAGAAAAVLVAGLAMLIWERTPELRREVRPGLAVSISPTVPTVEPEPAPRPPAQGLSAPATQSPTSHPTPPSRPRAERKRAIAPKADEPVAPPEPPPPAPTPEAKIEREQPPPSATPGRGFSASSERRDLRARPAPSAVQRTLTAAPPSDFAGRLIARDRAAAVVAVSDLASKVGGHERARRQDGSETVIEVQLPAARYDEFTRGLEGLGAWTSAGRPDVLSLDPPQIRLTIRVSG
jgi:Putative zinc-finger